MTATELVTTRDTSPARRTRRPTYVRSQGRRQKKSIVLTIVMAIFVIYSIVPLAWLLFNATKDQGDLFSSFGLWFGADFNLWQNIVDTLTYRGGIFVQWFGNTLLYVVVGAGGATLLATVAGYGMAKYAFPGRRAVFALVLGAVAIPGTALAVPTFLMFSQLGLTNTPWAVILPSLISPFGLYLIWTYAVDAVPTELLEAARIDGAGEFRTFFTISLRLLAPGIVTVLLFAIVATWNNYFLPLIMLSEPTWYPLTVGLSQWSAQASGVAAQPIYNLVITGSLLTIIPIVAAFLVLQRFWQSGLSAGSVKA
ncbi:carbohydrate ABC transporter permease [Microbacterium sp. EYE_5]|uniref:carbohydrate ABC transporter permease n=1 Tax=unclassified Microbacterium TaxID=2609290 RepID=UPI0020062FC2|nr:MULTISPECIES: carbohydrate ABC transporter permease [unclassified Microbacterium]MCK6080207.1 carbohydrate ABC transporter permease [Microbacterium sp. EYE_382]MCK6085478.1 carbohydrate ABC transporter permease [Microbacterium sp. EYE_384]MCK6122297.1 carbohydrate ABC transporter permease [Microbacterium sp. EYE_80]MCK6126241.1 carbohydrate ABC transporter permease [Microbacterium sp. EYE_79]MCK6141162.1 carbohydrate ABC transporter permease [Microbacterium sp. EYE_39]